jgi:hypothetical protein
LAYHEQILYHYRRFFGNNEAHHQANYLLVDVFSSSPGLVGNRFEGCSRNEQGIFIEIYYR